MALPKINLERIPPFVKTLLLIVPLIIVFLLLNYLVLSTKARVLDAIKKEVNKLEADIGNSKRQLVNFKPLSELENKEIAETTEAFQRMIQSLRTVREVYDRITSKAVTCGIMDLSIDPSYLSMQSEEVVKVEGLLGLDRYRSYMKLNFHCELKSLGCFLEGLTAGEDYLLIESLTIKRELPKPGVELVLKLFTRS